MPGGKLPGGDGHAGWGTDGRGDVSLRETDSFRRQLVNIRRGNAAAITTQIAVPEIISQNQNDIWPAITSGGEW